MATVVVTGSEDLQLDGLYMKQSKDFNGQPVFARRCYCDMKAASLSYDTAYGNWVFCRGNSCIARFSIDLRAGALPLEMDLRMRYGPIWGDWELPDGAPVRLLLLVPGNVPWVLTQAEHAKALGRALTPTEKVLHYKREWEESKPIWDACGAPYPFDPDENDDGAWKAMHENLFKRVYDHNERTIFGLLKRDKVADLGAHKGFFFYFLAQTHPQTKFRVQAFEPADVNIENVKRNAKRLTLQSHGRVKVRVKHKAVGATRGVREFVEDPDNTWKCCFEGETVGRQQNLPSNVVQVESVQDILESLKPTVIKMDVEGADIDILQSTAIRWTSVRVLLVEYSIAREILRFGPESKKRFAAVLRHLRACGFVSFHLPSEIFHSNRWNPGERRQGVDFVFLASKIPPESGSSLGSKSLQFIEQFG